LGGGLLALRWGGLSEKKQAAQMGGLLKMWRENSAFAELRSATGCLEAVLREFLSCFSLIFRAFPAFCFSVIRYADHKKSPFFIQR